MKNKVLLFIFALVTIPFMALAQGTGLIGSEIPVDLFTTFASLVLGIPFVVELVKRIFKPSEGIWTQVVSWITAIAVTFIGWALKLGFLEGLLWYETLAVSVGVGLAANGIFDTGVITAILKFLHIIK